MVIYACAETGSEDDGLLDTSDDDFFLNGSSSEVEADDEWTDKSTRYSTTNDSIFFWKYKESKLVIFFIKIVYVIPHVVWVSMREKLS